jgi:hypothetical protein
VKKGECTVNRAVEILQNPDYRKYVHFVRLQYAQAEVVLQTRRLALYRQSDELQLSIANQPKHERIYILDDIPPVEKAVISTMGLVAYGGYKMDARLRITAPDGKPCGELMHRITSAVYGVRLDTLVNYKIKYAQRVLPDGRYDYRLGNVWFPRNRFSLDLGQPVKIDRVDDKISVFRGKLHQETIYDYTNGIWEILNKYPVFCRARDYRETLRVDSNHIYLLYRVALADHLCGGLPSEHDALIAATERFEREYGADLDIDHLDGDCLNCRIINLMLMTRSQNVRKEKIQSQLQKQGKLHDFSIIRASDDTVTIRSDRYQINEVCGIERMLVILEQFI